MLQEQPFLDPHCSFRPIQPILNALPAEPFGTLSRQRSKVTASCSLTNHPLQVGQSRSGADESFP